MGTDTSTSAPRRRGFFDATICLERDYPHAPEKVWRALTEPRLVSAWLMKTVDVAPVVGTKFRLTGTPQPGWRGWVECEVLAVEPQRLFRYSWSGQEGQVMEVTWTLDAIPTGTRLTLRHEGFEGVGGFLLAKLMMGPGWKKMMSGTLASVLSRVGDDGAFRADPTIDRS